MNPCEQNVTSYIRETCHVLTILEEVHDLPEHVWLVSTDVNSLCTMIPNKAVLHAGYYTLHEFRPDPRVKRSTYSLVHLLEVVLSKNNFKFKGKNYLQMNGTSMGTKAAPSYANTFMGKFNDLLYTYHTQPLQWKRSVPP